MHAFNTLHELIQEAAAKVAVFNAAKAEHDLMAGVRNVH
jgi:hypothetical protein